MIRDAASQRQVDAADPGTSTWLSANAGSGKTRVLTDRVARLLLEGVSPQNILCLTYTKAAAAEMQNRLFKRLGAWAMMEDAPLREDLRKLGVDRAIDAVQLREARTLFARAIETPGGLKIQTIHSFCAAVLRRFPLEAGVSPQFREMEDREAEFLRADVMDALVEGADTEAVHEVMARFTGADFGTLTAEVAQKRAALSQDVDRAAVCALVDVDPALTMAGLVADVFDADAMTQIVALRHACAAGSKNDAKAAATLLQIISDRPPSADDLIILENVFLTGEGAKEPFTAKIGTFPTKSTREKHPDLIEAIAPLMMKVQEARDDRLALEAVDRTMAIYHFGRAFNRAYEAAKLARGLLDYDDLILKTKALLTDRAVAAWVLFRLDGGIDHMLVDEAQDTSPTQWAVIRQLAAEFAAGEGARADKDRTIFVVGDKKQSIYSFQGADPAAFDDMHEHFKDSHKAIGKAFETTSLDYSFRSSQAILSVVDATFVGDRGAGMDDDLTHIAFYDTMPGRVDLWPVIEKPAAEEKPPWYAPVDTPSPTNHNVLMAERVAAQIGHIITHEKLPVEKDGAWVGRPTTEGDILILVQRRSELFAEIIRACKAAGLNIAGADRLRVGAELAVKDLAALLRFLALPEDDLSLAAVLRSPLFGWSQQDLFTLAHHRPEKGYLWPALRDGDYPDTRAVLDDLRRQADFLRPYDLIERILTRHDGRRKLLARLGPEAEDGIDALLTQALAYESSDVPSLTGFLTWMETDDLEIKRQMDNQGDRIRVMTVHGAKGLEAPIVILPDAAKRDIRVRQELLPAGKHVIWKTPAKESAPAVSALRDQVIAAEARERMRLLYVAMTRAEKWLIVGAAGDVGDGNDSWYNIIADGMRQRGDFDAKVGDLPMRRVAHLGWDDLPVLETVDTSVPVAPSPDFGPLPAVTRTGTIAPSELPGPKVLPGDPAGEDLEAALTRGALIHRLLEHLPGVPFDRRAELGRRLEADEELVAEVMALIDTRALAALWDNAALTEVDITADIMGLGRIHGAIDRLIITDDRVLAIDYKSNRLVPPNANATPLGVLRQMAVYQAALADIYPDREVEIAILWTHDGTLMPIPREVLHEALNSVTHP
ncbi:double-strand break repair helicase AddA [Yoonia sp. 2307UL14-13]|uniref:double-strand break repair helicase AddA n=1 Tax=Yoonia sp. 2307UL14-13 TaxID=3126506 RepID=UPI00309B0B93